MKNYAVLTSIRLPSPKKLCHDLKLPCTTYTKEADTCPVSHNRSIIIVLVPLQFFQRKLGNTKKRKEISMDENRELMEVNPTRKTKIWATLVGIAIEAPILGLMGFSFLSSITLLVITSPLLIIFSPLLMGAAAVLAVAMAGFGVAGITAGLGLSSFVLVYRSLIKGIGKMSGEYGGVDDVSVTVDKTIQPAETTEEQQRDTEVAGPVDSTEAVNKQQEGSTTSEPVTVDKMVELFESLKDHPQDQNETATVVHVVTVEVDDDELEEHQQKKDMPSSGGYLQQNVQRQIPQET